MPDYLDIPFESDPDALAKIAFDYLGTIYPNWAPSEGNLDVMLIRAMSHIAAELQDIASAVPTTIYRFMGANLFAIPPQEAVAAQGTTTWVMQDNAGYTVPAGTTVGVQSSGNDPVAFQTINDFTVAPGSTTATGVLIEAVVPGADGSNLTGNVFLIDSLGFISTITLTAPTLGGLDAELDDDYLARLTTQLQLLAPRPIVPNDFSLMAIDVTGVGRATTIDGYNPADGTYANPRMVTMAAVDGSGSPVSGSVKTAMQEFFDARREVNFVVNIIDPVVTAVDVVYQVEAEPAFTDTADVMARVNAAVAAFLDPSGWGLPTSGDQIIWINDPTVRYLSLATAIKEVQGVWHVEGLTLALSGGVQNNTDLTLPGAIALPTPGVISGTVDLAS